MSWSVVSKVLFAFPFCSFGMILIELIWWDTHEVTMLDNICYIMGKQVIGL